MKTLAIFATFAASALVAFAEDKKVPDVSVDQVRFGEVVNETELDTSALKGKVVVVERWGVRCPPCLASLPDMAKLARRYDSKGLVVVGQEVQNSSKEDIQEVLKDARVAFPVTKGGSLPVSSNGIPHVAVFGVDGKLIWHGNPHNKEFEREVKKALREVKK